MTELDRDVAHEKRWRALFDEAVEERARHPERKHHYAIAWLIGGSLDEHDIRQLDLFGPRP